jgi:hypothetical protein
MVPGCRLPAEGTAHSEPTDPERHTGALGIDPGVDKGAAGRAGSLQWREDHIRLAARRSWAEAEESRESGFGRERAGRRELAAAAGRTEAAEEDSLDCIPGEGIGCCYPKGRS